MGKVCNLHSRQRPLAKGHSFSRRNGRHRWRESPAASRYATAVKTHSKDPGEGKAAGLARREICGDAKQFQTTRWSGVLDSAQSRAPGYKEAFADLCKIYWYPLYGFIRHRGYSPEDAEDLVQGFFLYLVERKTLSRADRSKGKFRSFLLASLQNFLSDEAARARRLKRGGKAGFVCINLEEAADRYGFEPVEELTPEKIFDARWAMALMGEVLNRLNREYVAQGKGTTFQALRGFLDPIHTKSLPSYEEAAAQLEVSVGALKALIHRLRKQYTALVREEISRTVSDATDVNSEIHRLCEALLAAEGWLMPLTEALNPVSDAGGGSADKEAGSILRRFENYEVVLDADGTPIELGHGAMGVTYKALDVDLRCPVTLKVISERYLGDESAQLRFLREARAAASVRHPNVASVFHLGRTGSSYFYAMEFVEGETLEQLIRRSGQVKVKVALEIITQVTAGLAAIHEQNLVHRDIKPSNILVRLKDDGNITAEIIDLGLAKAVNEPSAQTAISTPGAFAGTPE